MLKESIKNQQFAVNNLLNYTDESFFLFKKNLKNNSGQLNLLIHPLCDISSDSIKYQRNLTKKMRRISQKNALLVFIETSGFDISPYVNRYQQFFHKFGIQNGFYVPTEIDDPVPCFEPNKNYRDPDQDLEKFIAPYALTEDEVSRRWDKIAELFKKLDVKKAIIEGQFYGETSLFDPSYLSPEEKRFLDDNNAKKLPIGCVGNTLIHLSVRGFPATVGSVVTPIPSLPGAW